jgi:DNA polymerase-3 subunit delta'
MNMPWLDAARDEFRERIESGRLAHAILLSGPAGTGKVAFARELVAGMLCLEDGWPACGSCRSCQLLDTGAHPDYSQLTYAVNERTDKLRSEVVISQVRKLTGALVLTRSLSPRKVALIHPAEAMNTNAANALLKTLEEPTGDTVLILVSNDPGQLPGTIRSRCQNLNVRPPSRQQASDWLMSAENISEDEAGAALQAASGSPLRARSMLADGHTEQFRTVRRTLHDLSARRTDAGAAMASLANIDPEYLWTWLSLCMAENLKRELTGPEGQTAPMPQAPGIASDLVRLQAGADRNRRLLATPVRKDLLLLDWLIQWAGLSGT